MELNIEVTIIMQKSKLPKAAVLSYAVVAVLFIAFFIYMAIFEHVSVQKTRDVRAGYTIDQYSVEEIEDPSAPIGIRKEYRWILGDIDTGESTLTFYLVHHYAEVYIDDELMYSLMPQKANQIGQSISSNWVTIPLYPSDSGKEVRVIVTPVYESVRNRTIEFHLGSFHELYVAQLKHDLPQLILSAACILLGLFIMLAQLALIWRKRSQNWDIFFLGNFTTILGVWKITDTRFSPFMFDGNTLVLGYLTIGALFLACIPLALYLNSRFTDLKPAPMLIVSLLASGATLIALFCQVFGIADFKQTLPLSHIMIILIAVTLLAMVFARKVKGKSSQARWNWGFTSLLIIGAFADLLVYYINKSSSGLVFTLLAVLLYTLSLFTINILDINKKAYTDTHTGLFNKSRWDALMDSPHPINEPIGMIMLDLNHLKYTNDTMGHEAGDKVIFNFANILRNTIPPNHTICRWGGDEFAVMITNANREAMEQYLEEIHTAVTAYNESGEKPAIYYAVGYALSTEFPELSREALFKKADERMYINKQQWYSENSV
ncbi:MAG: GGDEF domain-containing protein [Oscillospiraceae bacterium]